MNTPGAQPANIQPTRNFAILHAAIYDAVNAIDRTHEPYLIAVRAPRDASETAAADAAAHTALVGLYPAQQSMLDADYAAELAKVADGPAKDQGVRVGDAGRSGPPRDPRERRLERHAAAVRRRHECRRLPADPAELPDCRLHHLGSGDAVRARQRQPVPAAAAAGADSDAYAAALNEVQSLGSATSTTRTAEQTEIGKFWNPPIQNFWNQIAQTVALAHHSDLPTTARLFAALNLSFADSAIAFYDAKYTYQLWRPVTAIRLADTDGNPETVADPNWLPLAGTHRADPSYPGCAQHDQRRRRRRARELLRRRPAFAVTSPALPGVTRSFTASAPPRKRPGVSRIYAGVHTRLDHVAGLTLGHDVAGFVLHNALLPAHDSSGR